MMNQTCAIRTNHNMVCIFHSIHGTAKKKLTIYSEDQELSDLSSDSDATSSALHIPVGKV